MRSAIAEVGRVLSQGGTAVMLLARRGYLTNHLTDPMPPVDLSQVRRDQNAGVCMGFKYDLNAYLAAQGNRVPVHNLDEIIQSQRFHPSVQPRLERAQQSTPQGPDSDACKSEMAYRLAFGEAVIKTMDQVKLDALSIRRGAIHRGSSVTSTLRTATTARFFHRPRASPLSKCRWATRATGCYQLA